MKRALLLGVALLIAPAAAWADIAVLSNGTTFKIGSRRVESGLVWLSLKDGGEVGLPEAAVSGYVPDEIVEEVAAAVAAAPPGLDLETLIAETARRHNLNPALVRSVVAVESAFHPNAVSPKGAQGLMQLMPHTARSLGVADPFDPAQNLDGGTRHLKDLVARYGGNLDLALAAYNAGQGAVQRHRGVPPYRETREYVKKVLERYRKGR